MAEWTLDRTVLVDGVAIDIIKEPIGISLSGGADSSLLLYILMSNHPGPIHAFTCVSAQKFRTAAKVSQAVIQRCIELTGNDGVVHHLWYVDRQDNTKLIPPQLEYLHSGFYNLRYIGITANPPEEVCATFSDATTETHERDPRIARTVHPGKHTHSPFTNIDKRRIAGMYRELGLLEDLFPVTRSCESVTQSEGHCGTCWWCQERQWGFGRLV